MRERRFEVLTGLACATAASAALAVAAAPAAAGDPTTPRPVPAVAAAFAAAPALTLPTWSTGTMPALSSTGKMPTLRPAAARTSAPNARQMVAAASIVSFARRQLGKPYVWGGTGPRGFDCSGLIQKAFAVAGIHLPRGSVAQAHAGTRINRSQLQPGDLVFSNGYDHVQLYIGDGKVIEAAHSGTRVRISRMLPGWMINAFVRVRLAK